MKLHLVFVVVVLHRAYCIEAKTIFEGRSRNTRKILKSYSKVYKLVSQSKKISNDQELIQSDPISCPQNQKGNN